MMYISIYSRKGKNVLVKKPIKDYTKDHYMSLYKQTFNISNFITLKNGDFISSAAYKKSIKKYQHLYSSYGMTTIVKNCISGRVSLDSMRANGYNGFNHDVVYTRDHKNDKIKMTKEEYLDSSNIFVHTKNKTQLIKDGTIIQIDVSEKEKYFKEGYKHMNKDRCIMFNLLTKSIEKIENKNREYYHIKFMNKNMFVYLYENTIYSALTIKKVLNKIQGTSWYKENKKNNITKLNYYGININKYRIYKEENENENKNKGFC